MANKLTKSGRTSTRAGTPKSAPAVVHWKFKESEKHLPIHLCQAMNSALQKKGSVIFKPHAKTGRYIGSCVNCEGIGFAAGIR